MADPYTARRDEPDHILLQMPGTEYGLTLDDARAIIDALTAALPPDGARTASAAVHVSISIAEMQDMIDTAVGSVTRAREEGRTEERAAIVAWLLDNGHVFASDDIERGKHREEDDNG